MKLKTYQAWTMAEALAFVKTDLGADAVILHTRTFERGGFFGIGKRSVVEITAARAQDLPKQDLPKQDLAKRDATRKDGSRVDVRGDAKLRSLSTPVADRAGERVGDSLRVSAAARAYGANVAVSGGMAEARSDAGLDMDAEREKTRRLAQAMAISLEKQASARASASRNEEVVREVAASRPAATARVEPQPIDGPAQRFVLVPESSPQGGVGRLTAAVVRPVEDGAESRTSVPTDAKADAPATSISPTHSSADTPRAMVETKPDGIVPELDAISEFVGRVLKRSSADVPTVSRGSVATAAAPAANIASIGAAVRAAPARPRAIESAYAMLLEQDLSKELADRVIADVSRRFAEVADPSDEAVRASLLERLTAVLPSDIGDAFEVEVGKHGPRRIALVGPTGVGKTTTLAKIAAHLKLKRGLRVGIVAADTYRIAAVDQLRTYAEILGLPVEIASSPKDAARACESLSDVDVILIDTAGRSQNDHMKVSELRAFLASADADETHLVLSATASARTLAREADAFCPLGVDRIVLTKLDEAATFGTLVCLVERLGKRVSFFTHGQEVPDHIEIARSRRLAALVLGSEVR